MGLETKIYGLSGKLGRVSSELYELGLEYSAGYADMHSRWSELKERSIARNMFGYYSDVSGFFDSTKSTIGKVLSRVSNIADIISNNPSSCIKRSENSRGASYADRNYADLGYSKGMKAYAFDDVAGLGDVAKILSGGNYFYSGGKPKRAWSWEERVRLLEEYVAECDSTPANVRGLKAILSKNAYLKRVKPEVFARANFLLDCLGKKAAGA